jgi:hypothetical protein
MRILDTNGIMFGTMTPLKGMTFIYDEIYLNKNNDPNIWSIQMNWEYNPHLEKSSIEEMTKSMSKQEIDARKFGKFIPKSGLVYKEFDEDKHIIAPFDVPVSWHNMISIDVGLKNPTSAHFYALDNDDNIIIMAEHYKAEETISYHANAIKDIAKRLNWQSYTEKLQNFKLATGQIKEIGDDFNPKLTQNNVDFNEKTTQNNNQNIINFAENTHQTEQFDSRFSKINHQYNNQLNNNENNNNQLANYNNTENNNNQLNNNNNQFNSQLDNNNDYKNNIHRAKTNHQAYQSNFGASHKNKNQPQNSFTLNSLAENYYKKPLIEPKIYTLIDSAANQRSISTGTNTVEEFAKHNIITNPNVNKSLNTGIDIVKQLLNLGKIKIFSTCTNLIREIKAYTWGTQDNPIKKDDHALDELRYYCSHVAKQNPSILTA